MMDLERIDRQNLSTLTSSPDQVTANRYELLSRMADGLAHEIKNPVHAAVINIELIRRWIAGPDPTRIEARLDILEGEVGIVHDLVDAFLRFLRPTTRGTGPTDLDRALGEILPLAYAYCRVAKVELVYPPSPAAFVYAGPGVVQQIVLNLIVEITEAMRPSGGEITIMTLAEDDEVHLHFTGRWPGGESLISPALCETAGLVISRYLAEEVDGRIEFERGTGDAEDAGLLLALRRVGGA